MKAKKKIVKQAAKSSKPKAKMAPKKKSKEIPPTIELPNGDVIQNPEHLKKQNEESEHSAGNAQAQSRG